MANSMYSADELKNRITDEIRTLGIMCYNMASENQELSDVIMQRVGVVRSVMSADEQSGVYGKNIEDAIMDTGYACYNLYVDNKLYKDGLLKVCRDIDSISNELKSVEQDIAGGADDFLSMRNGEVYNFEAGDYPDDIASSVISDREEHSAGRVTHSAFKINHPYGMEPIPENFVKCKCGYRNRAYANFCGKCGAKLTRRDSGDGFS